MTLGSTYQQQEAAYGRIVAALGTLPVRAVATYGPIDPPSTPAPPNVHVVASAPHAAVLAETSAVVCHGGHGTVMKALARGLPRLGHNRAAMRVAGFVLLAVCATACADRSSAPDAPASGETDAAPRDAQHQGVMGPHGDHTPRHGGLVLMNGDVHYEIVLAANGRHQIWFSDALRNELPASVASGVTMEVTRPDTAPEIVSLAIDEAGEAWVASARPLAGDGVTVKVRYVLHGEPQPHEIEIPFVPAAVR